MAQQWKAPSYATPSDEWTPPDYAVIAPDEVALTIKSKSSPIEEPELPDYATPIEESEIPESRLIQAWRTANNPIVNVPGSTDAFKEAHPTVAAIGDIGASLLSTLTSPLNVATAGSFTGANVAAKALPTIAKVLQNTGRALSAPVTAEGAINTFNPDSTLGERGAGLLEMAGGILGMKSKLPTIADDVVSPPIVPPVDDYRSWWNKEVEPNLTDGPTSIDKLIAKLDEGKTKNVDQKEIYRKERAEKFANANDVTTPGLQGHFERLGRLKGEHSKVSMEPIGLEQTDVDDLINTIYNIPNQMPFTERLNATEGLRKILEGKVPQDNEIKLLEKVFGEEKITALKQGLPKIDRKRSQWMEAINLPRAIQSSFDLSAPFRQGIGLIGTKSWWTSWNSMIKSYGSEKAFRAVQDSITERPNYKQLVNKDGKIQPSFGEQAGLFLSDLTSLSNREEAIMSSLAERIPLGIGKQVRGSNRAMTAFLNKIRTDNFDRLINDAEKIYYNAKATARGADAIKNAELLNPRKNLVLAKELASFVNNASGRGSLGPLEKSASALNATLFSPRLIASRMQMMNPRNYVFASPQVRKEYLKSILSVAGAWTTVAGLGKMAGADVNMDPDNADFGKVKIGNTRLDPAGGFQQYLVLAHRLASGEFTTSTSGNTREFGSGYGVKERGDALVEFIGNKLAPVPGVGYGVTFANENRPYDVVDRTVRMFTPILLQDLSELIQEDPALIGGIVPSAFGMGTQTYDERGNDSKLLGDILPEMEFQGGSFFK